MAVDERPVFTETTAQPGVPQLARIPDVSPVYEALDNIAKFGGQYFENLYKQDQQIAIVKAKNDISSSLLKASQKAQEQTDWTTIAQTFSDDSAVLKKRVLETAPDRHTQLQIQQFYDESVLHTSASVAQNVLQKKHTAIMADAEKTQQFILSNVANDPERSADGAPLNTKSKVQADALANNLFLAGSLSKDDREKYRQNLRAQIDHDAAQQIVMDEPAKALKLLRQENPDGEGVGIWKNFIDLPTSKRLELIKQAERQGEADKSNVNELMAQNVNNILSGKTGATEGQMRSHNATVTQLEDFRGQTIASRDARSMIVKLGSTPNGEGTAALLKEFMDKADVPDKGRYHDQIRSLVQKAYYDDLAMRQNDAAAYVLTRNPDANLPTDPIGLDRWVIAQERALGIPEKLLPNSSRDALITKFNTAPADQKIGVIQEIANNHGAVYGNKIAAEMMDGKVTSNFPLMFGQTKGVVLADIAKSGDIHIAEQEKLIGAEADVTNFKSNFETEWNAVKDRMDPDPNMQAHYHDAFYRLALYYRGSESDPAKAAFKNAYKDNYYESTPFSIPKTVPQQNVLSVVATANSITRNADKLDLNVGTKDPVQRKLMTDKLLQNARWIPALNEQGVALYSPTLRQVLTNSKNEPIQFRFSSANTDPHGMLEAGLTNTGPSKDIVTQGRAQGRGEAPVQFGSRPGAEQAMNTRSQLFEINADRTNREFRELASDDDVLGRSGPANPPNPKDKQPKPTRATGRKR